MTRATSPGAARSSGASPDGPGRPARSGPVTAARPAPRPGSSSTARAGDASAATPATSGAVYAVLTGTTVSPYRSAATYATTRSTLGPADSRRWSPGASTAAALRAAAVAV